MGTNNELNPAKSNKKTSNKKLDPQIPDFLKKSKTLQMTPLIKNTSSQKRSPIRINKKLE